MKFTDSNFVIGVFDLIGNAIRKITDLLSLLPAAIPIFTTLGVLAFNALGHKLRELKLAKDLHEIEQSRNILNEEKEITEAKGKIEDYKKNKTTEILTDPEKVAEKEQIFAEASAEDKGKLTGAHDAIVQAQAEVDASEAAVYDSESKEKAIEAEIEAVDQEVAQQEATAQK